MKRLLGHVRKHKTILLLIVTVLAALILEQTKHQRLADVLLGVVALCAATSLLWQAWQTLRNGGFAFNILSPIAIAAAVWLGEYWAAIVVVIMHLLTAVLRERVEQMIRSSGQTNTTAPASAEIIRKGKTITVPVSDLHLGDKITIDKDAILPVDASLLDEHAEFDESPLTGSTSIQQKQKGEQLLGGSVNQGGSVLAKVTSNTEDSYYQQMLTLARKAPNHHGQFVRLAERYTLPFSFAALALATALWIFTGEAVRFLEVLLVASPFPFLVAALPIAGGITRGQMRGITFKNGAVLERFADTATLAFQNAGVISRGEPTVTSITAFGNHDQDTVLGLVASLGQASSDRLARAATVEAKMRSIKLTKVKHIKEFSVFGIGAQLKGQTILVGRQSLFEQEDIAIPRKPAKATDNTVQLYLAIDGEVVGVINFSESFQPGVQEAIQQLSTSGIRKTMLLSTDSTANAQATAQQLGISEAFGELTPTKTLHLFETIKNRPLTFVGDNMSDTATLHAASVAVSLNSRFAPASNREVSKVLIASDETSQVALAYRLARQSLRVAQQSVWLGIGLSLGLMAVFATGKASPLAGAFAQQLVVLVSLALALRIRRA